jgi:hypothetical protein
MALTPSVLTDVRIYLAGADLTGFSNKVEILPTVEDKEFTNFASGGWKERTGGLFSTASSVESFWQAGDLSMPDDAYWAALGVNTAPFTVVPTSGAVGQLAYLTRMLQKGYKLGGPDGEIMTAMADLSGNWPQVRGQIMHPQGTARTASGNGTGLQLGAVLAAQRFYACLHVLSIAGTATPTITVKIQSNVDNTFAAPTDRITFTAATTLSGQASSVLGAITDTWWRAVWTISGTTPSFLFAVSGGIAAK